MEFKTQGMANAGNIMSNQGNNPFPPAWAEWLATGRLEVEFANHTPAPPDWRLRGRCLDHFHLVMLQAGRATYTLEGQTVRLGRGTLILVGPGLPHSAEPDPQAWPHLLTARFRLLAANRPYPLAETFWLTRELADAPRFAEWLAELFRLYSAGTPDPLCAVAGRALLTRLLAELARQPVAGTPTLDPRIESVRQRIWEHPEQAFTIAQLARLAELSPRRFKPLFTSQVGLPPRQYQIKIRGERARELLLETDRSLKQIAFALGYPDQFAFSKQFKQLAGCSPRAYRLAGR